MLPTNSFDVAVIGAGPAGASAAQLLAQAGHSVALVEKARLPRYKTCGGGVLARAFPLLPPGVEEVVECAFNSVSLYFHKPDMRFLAARPQPVVRMTMRADLDNRLARAAVQAGTHLIESCAVNRATTHGAGVEIVAGEQTIRAQFIVGADGVHSTVARSGGWPELTSLAPALEHEIYLRPVDFDRFRQQPRFDFGTIDAGYAWVFPKRDHLSAGILSTRRTCPELQTKLLQYLQAVGITDIQKTEKHGYLIPLRPRRGPLVRGRMLLAGDAAGLVDPVTAEGITHAIVSGQLAARAIMEGKFDAAKVAGIYQSLLEEHILGDLRAARFLARMLYHHPRIRNALFRRNGQRLCEFVTRVITGEARYRDALKRPASYFKLLGG